MYKQYPFKLKQLFLESRYCLSLALIILVPSALYYQTFSFGLVWDDLTIAFSGNTLLNNPSVDNVLYFWIKPENGMYIPVTYTTWSIIELFNINTLKKAFNPGTYHFINTLVHILNGILVFVIIHRFVKSIAAVTAGTIFFLIHPVQVETVAWIFEFRTLLATFFGLFSLYWYFIFLDESVVNQRKTASKFLWISFVSFILAILSKPSLVVLPLLLVSAHYFFYENRFSSVVRKVIPWLLASIVITFITLAAQPQQELAVKSVSPYWLRPLIWMDSINFYTSKILMPVSLSPSYDRTTGQLMQHNWFFFSSLVPILATVIFYRRFADNKILLFAFALFIIGFLPVSGIFPFWFQYWSNVADRYIYLSMLGISLIFAYIFFYAKSVICQLVLSGFLLFCAFWSMTIQIPIWQSEIALWDHAIQVKKDNPRALYNRGITYAQYGMWNEALADINESAFIDRKRFKETEDNFFKQEDILDNLTWSIDSSPDVAKFLARAYLHFRNGSLKPAVADMQSFLKSKPKAIDQFFSSPDNNIPASDGSRILSVLSISAHEFGDLIPELYIYVALAKQYMNHDDSTMDKHFENVSITDLKSGTIHHRKVKELFNVK